MRWVLPAVVGMIVSMAAGVGEAASCAGNACQEVALESQGSCVWLRSRSEVRVDVTVRLADGSIDVSLEPASKAKADQREARRAAAEAAAKKAPSPNLCRRALSSEEMRNRLRAQGQSLPASPEIEGVAEQCRRAAVVQADETAYHGYKFEPLFPSSKGTPVYRKRLARGAGCVARLEDVVSYTTRAEGRAVKEAAVFQPIGKCTGDACKVAVFGEECRLTNTGDRSIAVKVSSSSVTFTISELKPGSSTQLTSPLGCVKPQDVTRYEATYK
jgi:hypothetical protein